MVAHARRPVSRTGRDGRLYGASSGAGGDVGRASRHFPTSGRFEPPGGPPWPRGNLRRPRQPCSLGRRSLSRRHQRRATLSGLVLGLPPSQRRYLVPLIAKNPIPCDACGLLYIRPRRERAATKTGPLMVPSIFDNQENEVDVKAGSLPPAFCLACVQAGACGCRILIHRATPKNDDRRRLGRMAEHSWGCGSCLRASWHSAGVL